MVILKENWKWNRKIHEKQPVQICEINCSNEWLGTELGSINSTVQLTFTVVSKFI